MLNVILCLQKKGGGMDNHRSCRIEWSLLTYFNVFVQLENEFTAVSVAMHFEN